MQRHKLTLKMLYHYVQIFLMVSNYGQVESRLRYLKSIFVAYKRICNKSATWHVSAYRTRNEYVIMLYFLVIVTMCLISLEFRVLFVKKYGSIVFLDVFKL